jgi:hypothetical protein
MFKLENLRLQNVAYMDPKLQMTTLLAVLQKIKTCTVCWHRGDVRYISKRSFGSRCVLMDERRTVALFGIVDGRSGEDYANPCPKNDLEIHIYFYWFELLV